VETIGSRLAAMALPGVVVGVRRIDAGDIAHLHPIEIEHVARAVDQRRAEFATGRALLRSLLGHDGPIPVGPDRAPVLPHQAVASLAHDRELAVAAVSTTSVVRALGIDVEPADPIAAEVAALILRPDESGIDAHLAFTVKEAVYKAWSRLGGRMLDHQEVRIEITGTTFAAIVLPDGVEIAGDCDTVDGRHVALVQFG